MNLHSIVGPIVGTVNPPLKGQFQRSTGYTTGSDGTQVPSYAAAIEIQAQTQALTYKDLMQLDGLNLNGEKRAMYVSGDWGGVDRPGQKGGDLISLSDGTVWLVAMVLENWQATAGWTKLAVVKQNV